MRGGTRTGAGRKKGQKDTKPRAGTEARKEYDQIQQMLSMGIKVKAKMYQEFLVRVANKDGKQKPLSLPEKKLMTQLAVELAAGTEGEKPAKVEDLDPDVFLRKVWNDNNVDMALRIRAAEVALKGNDGPKGKKEEKDIKARQAGAGKFQAGAPPLKVVK